MNLAALRRGSFGLILGLFLVAFIASRLRRGSSLDVGAFAPLRVRFSLTGPAMPSQMAQGVTPFVVGRSPSCDVVVADLDASRFHARFENEEDVLFVRDLESTNGTFLNESRVIGAIEVLVDDDIDIGTSRMRVMEIERWV